MLADLEAHDPDAPEGNGERRFLCPLPVCADKQRGPHHRSLSVNVSTGLWNCQRCKAAGKLREHWTDRPRVGRKAAALRSLTLTPERPAVRLDPLDLSGTGAFMRTPGQDYLDRRGIRYSHAAEAGVRFASDWYGRQALVFPIKDRGGVVVAAESRCLDDRSPNKLSKGPKKGGVFSTFGAFDAKPVIICEAPLDALSLATAGFPALALCGTTPPAWLPSELALRAVVIAFDNDQAGEDAAPKLAASLTLGSQVCRLRPRLKDWNEQLLSDGPEELAEYVGSVIALGCRRAWT